MQRKVSLNISESTMRSIEKSRSDSNSLSLIENPIERNQQSPIRNTRCSTRNQNKPTEEDKLQVQLKSLEYEISHSKRSSDLNTSYRQLQLDPLFPEAREADFTCREETNHGTLPRLKWCPYCAAECSTKIKFHSDNRTLWTSVTIFMLGGVFGCFLLPFMTNSCQALRIVCSRCDHTL